MDDAEKARRYDQLVAHISELRDYNRGVYDRLSDSQRNLLGWFVDSADMLQEILDSGEQA